MANNQTYNLRIDANIRRQADALYRSMGLSLSAAVNLFLTQSVIQGRLPIAEILGEPAYAEMLLRDAADVDLSIADGAADVYAMESLQKEMQGEWEKAGIYSEEDLEALMREVREEVEGV